MIISGIDNVEVEKILPGDTVILQRVSKEITNSLFIHSENIGCKLIFLQYGKFYLKDERYNRRVKIINNLLEDELSE